MQKTFLKTMRRIWIPAFAGMTLAFIIFLSIFNFAYALGDYTVLTPLPGTTKAGTTQTDLSTYLPGLFTFAIGLSAFAAFVMITAGGVMYMTTDNIGGKSKGKEYITNALWGLVLVIGAWVILNTINPQILNFTLSMPVPNIKEAPLIQYLGSTNGLQPAAQQAFADLNSKCPDCNINVTSTTGGTHDPTSTHYQGLAEDMSSNAKFDTFVKTGQQGTSNGCTTYTQTLGGKTTTFLWEPKGATCGGAVPSSGDHWHASVTP